MLHAAARYTWSLLFWLSLNESLQFLSFTLKERWVFVCFPPHPPLSPPGLAGALTPGPRLCLETNCGGCSGYRCPIDALARCRVARRLECRCMADRYHNHTSPPLIAYLLNKTSAFLLVDRSSSPKSGGKEASWSVFEISEVTREKSPMIPNKWGPQSCFYLRHLQTDPPDWQCFVPGRCNNLYLRCYIQNNLLINSGWIIAEKFNYLHFAGDPSSIGHP